MDPACRFPYEANNEGAVFLEKSVEKLRGEELDTLWANAELRVLAGCAPCQPFSTYSQGKDKSGDGRWNLLLQFGRLVKQSEPDLVTMENVPGLSKQDVFRKFVNRLRDLGYHVSYQTVYCPDYGVPQQRQRLVLLASRLGSIELIKPTHPKGSHRSVRDVIGKLKPIAAGEAAARDSLHQAASLSPINLKRIRASVPGGTWRDWDADLVADCHKKASGRKYSSIYGRMEWDRPAPTLTTQFYNFGSGRYGHPEQDRAISFREGALIQGFPKNYSFFEPGSNIGRNDLGRLIGNAVPVQLGEAIGKSVLKHVRKYS